MNIVQISFLLGHAQLQTTMIYLDIATEQQAKAMATLEDENDKKGIAKWKITENGIASMCGFNKLNKKKINKLQTILMKYFTKCNG